MPELKPCPFCGSDALLHGDYGEVEGYYVECSRCNSTLGEHYNAYGEADHRFNSAEQATTAWNTRAEQQKGTDEH